MNFVKALTPNPHPRSHVKHQYVRSAGFEPAFPSLGSSYLNQAGLTSQYSF